MVTIENVLMLGLALIVLTFLANAGIGIIDFVDENVRILID